MSPAIFAATLLLSADIGAPVAAAQDMAEIDENSDAELAFRSGQGQFQRGQYESAMESFQEAYELSARPELLYNIGRSADLAGLIREALPAFEHYLEDVSPVHPRRAAIERRVVALREEIAAAGAEGPEGPGAAPWIVVGIGAAAAITGGILLGVGLTDLAALEDPDPATPPADVEDSRSGARGLSVAGAVALTVGVITLIGGLFWALTSATEGEVGVEAGIGPGTLILRGRF